MLTPYLIPVLLIATSAVWFFYIIGRPPRVEIFCDPSRHPFRQEWDDNGGHQILFRIGVKNVSKFTAVNRAQVLVTGSDPFMMRCIPARLLLMNEDRSARDFFLPPDATQYVDVLQQSQPSGDLLLWHTVCNQEIRIHPGNYIITTTVYGANTEAISKRFSISQQGTVFALIPQGIESI